MPGQHLYIQAFDWHSALIRISLPVPSAVEALSLPDRKPLGRTGEDYATARLPIGDLPPDTDIDLEVRWTGGSQRLRFRTLPAPRGDLLFSFAALADPHISLRKENRKGRLLVESRSILRDSVEDLRDLNVQGVSISGDVTDRGAPEEYAAAQTILSPLPCPLYAAPGDHDRAHKPASGWEAAFGPPACIRESGGFVIVTLDTAQGTLGEAGRRLLRDALSRPRRALIVISHLQLFADPYIAAVKPKAVSDAQACRDLLDELTRTPTLIYAGHQNVPSRVKRGAAMQLNLPQPVQFPCGYVWLRVFENGFYHTFRPIRSIELDEASRRGNAAAALHYGEPQWRESYRLGQGPEQANFLFQPTSFGKG